MVCNLTKTDADEVDAICTRANAAISTFRQLADADAESFAAVMAAYKMPKNERDAALQPALKSAASVPLQVMALAASLVPDASILADNGHIVTDASMRTPLAGLFAAGTVRAGHAGRAAAAAGDGALAAIAAAGYLDGGDWVA